jgi:hypothetical protein
MAQIKKKSKEQHSLLTSVFYVRAVSSVFSVSVRVGTAITNTITLSCYKTNNKLHFFFIMTLLC